MITSWGLLAFLKAADTRQNASFAIRLDKKGEFDQYEDELRGEGYYDAEGFIQEIDKLNPQRAESHMPENDYRKTRVSEHRRNKSDNIGEHKPPRRSVKYQNFDDFLDDNLQSSEYDHHGMNSSVGGSPSDPLTLDDLFGGDKK